MLALAGIGTTAPKVKARTGSNLDNFDGCHFFMAQM
jgi:hypothetical protein